MLNCLNSLGRSRWYWLFLLVAGLSTEAVALYYQYALQEYPCVLCIQVRIWVLALILVSLPALWLCRYVIPRLLMHLLTVVIAAGLLERSYQLLGTERGFTVSECGFDLGMPSWLALDQWFPLVFEVQTSCGYTPELLFGVTMAEALLAMSAVLLLWTLTLTVATLKAGLFGRTV